MNMFEGSIIRNPTVYIYIRVSTSKQECQSQFIEVKNYCINNNLIPEEENIYIDENTSGTITWKKRKLNNIIEKLKKNDTIIVPEISRLGRNMFENSEIFNICKNLNVKIIIIKHNMIFDGSFNSSMMVSFYSMFSEMERNLISERTKQGMLVAKMKGHMDKEHRGVRPNKLDKFKDIIEIDINLGLSYKNMVIKYNTGMQQIALYIKKLGLIDLYKSKSYLRKENKKNIKIITI